MRISDWSSDVCSSDLEARAGGDAELAAGAGGAAGGRPAGLPGVRAAEDQAPSPAPQPQPDAARRVQRQGRRRGGRAGPAWRGGDRAAAVDGAVGAAADRSEEDTSELQSLMRSSYAGYCLNKKQY